MSTAASAQRSMCTYACGAGHGQPTKFTLGKYFERSSSAASPPARVSARARHSNRTLDVATASAVPLIQLRPRRGRIELTIESQRPTRTPTDRNRCHLLMPFPCLSVRVHDISLKSGLPLKGSVVVECTSASWKKSSAAGTYTIDLADTDQCSTIEPWATQDRWSVEAWV